MKLFLLLCSSSLIRTVLSVLCEVGEALKDPTNPTVDRTCSAGFQSCPADYICTSQPGSTISVCCPSKLAVCSQPRFAGSTCGTATPSARFYFDASRGACQTFTYNGCFGNNNNFHNRDECERVCLSILCPKGLPARSGGGVVQQCQFGSSNQCPLNFECTASGPSMMTGSFCCPSAASICSQPMQIGSACSGSSQPIQRYYYDGQSRTCYGFLYQGCRGNDNNFATAQECMQYCSGAGQLCSANTVAAPGTTASTPCSSSAQCPQGYSCQYSLTQRQSYCCSVGGPLNDLCPVGMAPAPGASSLTTCNTISDCPTGYSCTPSPASGLSYCCSQASPVDQMCPLGSIPAPGVTQLSPCSQFSQCPPSYSCQYSFTYRQSYCCSSVGPGTSQICPAGSLAAPGTTLDTPCNPFTNSCPTGYTCQLSLWNRQSYCCSSSINQFCPLGSVAQPGVTATTPCNQYTTCQQGYTCQYSQAQRQSFCCSIGNTGQLCPVGSVPATDQPCQNSAQCPSGSSCLPSANGQSYCCFSGQSSGPLCPSGSYAASGTTFNTPCTPLTTCPTGFSCQYSPASGQSYCCSDRIDPTQRYCPTGATLAPGSTRTCSPYSDQCPVGYSCQQSPITQRWYCCSSTNQGLCPLGSSPALGTTPLSTCNSDTGCPIGYTCQISPASGRSYCCQHSPSQTQLCPIGTSPAPNVNPNTPCLTSATCPNGYTCQRSPSSTFSYCCSITSVQPMQICPGGSTPAMGTTIDTPCSASTLCPSGFTCQRSPSNGLLYCCSQTSMPNGLCPQGGTALYYPNTQQQVTCTMNGQQCLFPYTCQINPGSSSGVCCSGPSPAGGDPDCPGGMIAVQNNGKVTYCSFGSTPQPQLCPPLSLCLMSTSRQVLVCCYTYRKMSTQVRGGAAHDQAAIQCKTSKDCPDQHAKCIKRKCQCPDGLALTSELDTCQRNSTIAAPGSPLVEAVTTPSDNVTITGP